MENMENNEHEEKNIEVKIPDKMEVYSSEITSMKEISERISNWLHVDFKEIIKPLQVLPQIPQIIKDFKQKVVQQFTQLSNNMMEADMVKKQASVKALAKKIGLMDKHIEKKSKGLEKSLERLDKRYENLSQDLADEHDEFLKALDSHVYGITENIYSKQIKDKISQLSMPNIKAMANHSIRVNHDRNMILEKVFNKTRNKVEDFLELRSCFYDDLAEFAINDKKEGNYKLPFYFIKLINKETKEEKYKIYFDWDINLNSHLVNSEDLINIAENKLGNNKVKVNIRDKVSKYLQNNDMLIEQEMKRFINVK